MFRGIIKGEKKCWGCCRRRVASVHSLFCPTCARIAMRMKIRRFPPEAEKAVWAYIRANDYRCYYTKMALEMNDIKSPWFCVFDHLVPLDPRTVVITCALFNEMKSALSQKEFWFYVGEFDGFFEHHTPIKKIKLGYWGRRLRLSRALRPPQKKPIWPHPKDKKCDICGRPVFTLRSKYCRRCSVFNKRMELKGFPPEVVEAIRAHLRAHGYVCQITGLALDMENPNSPWYGEFDMMIPGDPTSVVLTFYLLCEMKSDLSLKEFRYYIRQLVNNHRNHTPIRKKTLVYWFRLSLRARFLKILRD